MTDSLKQARTLVTDVVAILRSRALFAELRNSPRRAALAAFSKETRKLSPRVEKAIVRQENESEILIGWSQLAVVALFGLFYLVAPKTFDPNMAFAPVPWALSLYFAATVIRIVWATGWRIPDWALYISIFIDVAMLMGLIWSFHLQYGQPASFALKAPTLLYVFIFIALRALRFEARFVVVAGIAATIGWASMVGYVITADPSDPMITRDYVEYITSNSVLLGAEFDKILSILAVTGIIAVAIRRGRTLLVRAVSEETAARELSRFFDKRVAEQITGAGEAISAGEGRTRDAAVLNVDVRGFTKLAGTMSAGDVMGLLAEYQRRMVPVIQAHDGTIDKFLGDGIMATFGAVTRSATYAADALRATDAVIDEACRWAAEREAAGLSPLVINASVAIGPIVFGAVGDETRLEYTVIGDAVNLSAKLEKHNKMLGAKAVVTAKAFDTAVVQGYEEPALDLERVESDLPDVAGQTDIVVLRR